MNKLPVIQVFALGGTIAMTPAHGAGVVPSLTAEDLVAAVPGLAAVATMRAETLVMVGSANLDFARIRDVCNRAEASDADGVIVTQGTDTLEETAFLASLLYRGGKPLVFTGAMRTPDKPGADGPSNIYDSALIAGAATTPKGVYVVMNGEVHDPWVVTKAHTSSVAAFRTEGGPLATISEGKAHWRSQPVSRPQYPMPEGMVPVPVALVQASFADDGRLLDHVLAAGYKGLVIEAFGAGHLSEVWADKAEKLAVVIPVVLASRTGGGRVFEATYGYKGAEIDLIARGLVPSGFLSGRKARIMLSLIASIKIEDWKQSFTGAVKSV